MHGPYHSHPRILRVLRAVVAVAAVFGFALGFAVTFVIGIEVTSSPECDGPCFEKWDEVSYVGYGIGATCALGFALVARSLFRRLLANRHAKPS